MKKIILSICLIINTGMLFSQSGTTLNETSRILFQNIKSKLSIAEKNQIAAKLGFVLSGNKDAPFALDKDSKDYPFIAFVYPSDINKDGKEEIFIVFGNTYTSGNTGSSVSLFIKNSRGEYMAHLGFPGVAPDVLTTSSLGYPDLLIGGPGFEYPVQRWDGKSYGFYKIVIDVDYEKLKKSSIDLISKAYQQTITQ